MTRARLEDDPHTRRSDYEQAVEEWDAYLLAADPAEPWVEHGRRHRAQCEAELRKLRLEDGDALLLCSDGLSGMVEDPKMLEVVKAAPDLETAVSNLIETANAAGGTDNITVLALQCAN